jgi:phospholipase C
MALKDIDTFVIVMLENRSFDHVAGYLSLPPPNPAMPVDGLRDDPAWIAAHANPNPLGGPPISVYPLADGVQTIADPPHDYVSIATQIDTAPQAGPPNGMGGFVKSYVASSPPDPKLVMGYYTGGGVTMFDFFAQHFVVCDNWYSSLPSGTQPNRLLAMSGMSFIKDDVSGPLPNQPLVYDWLAQNNITWCSYQWAGFPFFTLMPHWSLTIVASLDDPENLGAFRRFDGFHDQWMSDAPLPSVIFIEPKYTDDPIGWAAPNDDHPPTGVARGQHLLHRVYQTLIGNPDRWARTMLIVDYDEHGGFFDHAPPLPIADTAGGYRFPTTGVRIPAFIVSPQVAERQVFHGKLDHTSVLRLLAERFTPGRPYSANVTARQNHLDPLADVLLPTLDAVPRAPQVPEHLHAVISMQSATAPMSPVGPTAPLQTDTARAFDQMARDLVRRHPAALDGEHGQTIKTYVVHAAPPQARRKPASALIGPLTPAAGATPAAVSRRAKPGKKGRKKAAQKPAGKVVKKAARKAGQKAGKKAAAKSGRKSTTSPRRKK